MTREDLIDRLRRLTEPEFARIAPFLEADLASVGELALLHREIEEGRRSARTEPLHDSEDVFARVRRALAP